MKLKTAKQKNQWNSWFFGKISNTDKLLTGLTKKKRRHKLPISGIKGDINTDPADIKKILREYYEQHTLDNSHVNKPFLEQHKLLLPTHYETDNLNSSNF